MIAVVDYCKGNLKSVERGLRAVGGNAQITADPNAIRKASAIVLPGVGAFADAANYMFQTGQMEVVVEAIKKGIPFLGICLGLHLLYSFGTEGSKDKISGMGLIDGCCIKLPVQSKEGREFKIPHVGWNTIEFDKTQVPSLLEGIEPGQYFYFTHSFYAPMSKNVIATTTHSIIFPSIVQVDKKAFGVQFHPEKSSDMGAKLLKNFVKLID